MNPKAVEMIAQASRREIFPVISTNLSLPLSDAEIDRLLLSGLGMLCAALDGAGPETYVRYRRGGNFGLVLENLTRLVRRKRQIGLSWPILEWRFLIFKHNQHETDRVRQMAEEIGVDSLDFFYGYAPDHAPPGEVEAATQVLVGPGESGPARDLGGRRTDTTLRRWLGPAKTQPFPAPDLVERRRKVGLAH